MLQVILDAVVTSAANQNEGVKLSKLQQQLLLRLQQTLNITIQALVMHLNKSLRTIERHLKVLQDHNYIECVGSAKTGHWKVIK